MRDVDDLITSIAADVFVYRSLRKNQYRNKEISVSAFIRRGRHPDTGELRDTQGLSVMNTSSNGFNLGGTIAVAQLLVGDIVSLGLGVLPNKPTHANITGLPAGEDVEDSPDIEKEAIRFGNELKKRVLEIFESE